MGDIIASLSLFYSKYLKSDCHLIFHYPDGHGYSQLIQSIMQSLERPPFQVSYEIDYSWSTVGEDTAVDKFGVEGKWGETTSEASTVWFFTGTYKKHLYWPFKTLWGGDIKGPVALSINHEDFNEHHPIISKFFSTEDNQYLMSLVDNKNFFLLGEHHDYQTNLDIIAKCRYVLGIEGGWTHVTNAMRAPFVVITNKRDPVAPAKVHSGHPNLRIRSVEEMYRYLT